MALEISQYLPFEASLCFPTVEKHMRDLRVSAEKSPKVVCGLSVTLNHGIQAPFPYA
jgi:hypothetical protein